MRQLFIFVLAINLVKVNKLCLHLADKCQQRRLPRSTVHQPWCPPASYTMTVLTAFADSKLSANTLLLRTWKVAAATAVVI